MKSICLTIIRIYQWWVSPLFGPTCRFAPSCSQYAADAIHQYGVVAGSGRAILRILKCHPFHPGGWDPVR